MKKWILKLSGFIGIGASVTGCTNALNASAIINNLLFASSNKQSQVLSPISLLAHTVAGCGTDCFNSGGGAPVTTVGINTTGAKMIAICATGSAAGPRITPTDSAHNTWFLVNSASESNDVQATLWYSVGPTTSPYHTFTATGQAPALSVMAFSGVASGPDQQASLPGYGSPFTVGTLSPATSHQLIVSCLAGTGSAPTINSPLNLIDAISVRTGNGGSVYSGSPATASAIQIQTSSSSVTPTWNIGGMGVAVVAGSFFAEVNPAALTISTTSLPEAFVGSAYSKQLVGSGGIGPYQWQKISGTLPSGITLTTAGLLSGTPTVPMNSSLVFKVTDAEGTVSTSLATPLIVAASRPTLASHSCTTTGTQYVPYGGCTLITTGGTAPYTYTYDNSPSFAGLPEGLLLNTTTGTISGTVYGQGGYITQFISTDAAGTQSTTTVTFSLAGNNTLGGCTLFPSDSAFHMDVSALPVDTSIAAPLLAGNLAAHIQPFFGSAPSDGQPFGIPMIAVPYNQALVPNSANVYQSYFGTTSGTAHCSGPLCGLGAPFPWYTPIEGTVNAGYWGGDNHALVIQTAGGGNPCKLWEMWQAHPPYATGATDASWIASSNAYWSNISNTGTGAYAMLPQDNGSADAAGLPIAPLLVTADEVIGNGTSSSPNGSVQHPIRFTLSQTLNHYVWPATSRAGLGQCSGGYEDGNRMLLQSNPPTSGCSGGPLGEIYRLKASVASPACASSSPQAAIIIQGMRNYGIILADNGRTGGLIGTPDSRWNDADLQCLTEFTLGNFEPVNVSSKIVDPISSYQTH